MNLRVTWVWQLRSSLLKGKLMCKLTRLSFCMFKSVWYSDTNRARILLEQKPPIQEHTARKALCCVLSHPWSSNRCYTQCVASHTDFILEIATCHNKQLKLTDVLTDQRKMIIPKALSVCTCVLCCQRQKDTYHLMSYTWYCLRQEKVSCTPGTGFCKSQEKSKHTTEKLTICIIWVIHSELQVYENKNIFNSYIES